MRRPVNTDTYIIFLLAFSLACFVNTKQLSAAPRYTDEPKKFGQVHLYHTDTTEPEFRVMIARLDSFYRTQVARGFNGSVLIGYKGQVLYERYFGYADFTTKRRLTPTSAVQLASTSKTFTATAIMYLHQHLYLDINDPVQMYLPTFPYKNVTIKMLLSHRSGIPDYLKWFARYRKDTKTPIYNDELIELFAKYKPGLEFTPNTRFKYSNSNYAILGRLIEEVTEMTYRDFMKHYFFEPLGMTSTFVYDPSWGLPESATKSYRYNWSLYNDMFADGVYGDKGIYSTVRDMYRWDQSFYNFDFLDSNTVETAYGPCSFERPGVKNYGLGWRMYCYPDGDKIVFHNGWWHGNNTVFLRFIKDNFTIIVLGNKYNKNIYQQGPTLYRIVTNSPMSDGYYEADDEGSDDLAGD
ncbi:MAG: beta-lactamase family protein [Chitinophagales bacterium]|nr:beta-lactamase family protein [Chitinophagaceae bacterium]MCB9064790.1 beta-lactamase family protein [Chitinophagales bacterium]